MENDLYVIVDQVLSPLPDPCPGGAGDDCFRLGFPVFFFDNSAGNSNTLPPTLTISNLTITGTVSGGNLDQQLSQECAPSGYTVTVNGTSFTYTHAGSITVNISDLSIGAPSLFDVAVEAKPGEQVSLSLSSVIFTYPAGGCQIDIDATSLHLQENYLPNPYPMSAPAACSGNNAVTLSLGSLLQFEDDGSHRVEVIPIEIDQNITVEEMDFQIILTDVAGTLEQVEFPEANGFDCFVEPLGNDQYKLYAHFEENSPQSFPQGELLLIKLHRPSLNNIAIEAEAYFDFARIHFSAGDCCAPAVSPGSGDAPYVVSLGSDSFCSDLEVSMTPVNTTAVADDCSAIPIAQYYVNIRNNSAQDISISFMELHVNFVTDGSNSNLTMDIQDDSNWWCTPGCSYDCFSTTGNTLVHLDCSADKILHDNESMSFLISLTATEAGTCITGAYFRIAKVIYDDDGDPGTPMVSCAPPPSNQPSEMRCGRSISGLVAKENEEGVGDVQVMVYGPDAPCNALYADAPRTENVSPACGTYQLCTSCDGLHQLIPEKDEDILCGVTTFDMVLIMRHILGIALLDSPYKMIAADVNKSNSISTLDLVAMQKVILLVENSFPNNESWRFVDASYVFPDPANPWVESFPEDIFIDFANGNVQTANFTAIKIGDVNLSCAVCGSNFQEPSDPDKVIVYLDNQGAYQAGDTIDLTFQVKDFTDFNSYQMGIGYDTDYLGYINVFSADLAGVSAVEGDDFHIDDPAGQIRTLWYEDQGGTKSLTNGEGLFRLRFKANAAFSDLQGKIWLADSILGNWTYDDSGTRHIFELQDQNGVQFNEAKGESSSKPMTSLRLAPNPFNQDVELSVWLRGSRTYELELDLFDLSGQQVWSQNYSLLSGQQHLILPFGKLERGLYVLRLRCNDQITYHKLIRQ